METGTIVRYRQEFLSSYTGIRYPFSDIADRCGEIIEISGKIARIRWDDNTISASLIRNIERAEWVPAPTPESVQRRQEFEGRIERAKALLELTKDFFATAD